MFPINRTWFVTPPPTQHNLLRYTEPQKQSKLELQTGKSKKGTRKSLIEKMCPVYTHQIPDIAISKSIKIMLLLIDVLMKIC